MVKNQLEEIDSAIAVLEDAILALERFNKVPSIGNLDLDLSECREMCSELRRRRERLVFVQKVDRTIAELESISEQNPNYIPLATLGSLRRAREKWDQIP